MEQLIVSCYINQPFFFFFIVSNILIHMEVVEWSARLARKRVFRVRRLLAPISMMRIPI